MNYKYPVAVGGVVLIVGAGIFGFSLLPKDNEPKEGGKYEKIFILGDHDCSLFLWMCVWLWEGKGRYQLLNNSNTRVGRIDAKTGDVALLVRESNERGRYLEIDAEYTRK